MDGLEDRTSNQESDRPHCFCAGTDLRDFLVHHGIDEYVDPSTVDQVDARVTDDGEILLAIWGEPR